MVGTYPETSLWVAFDGRNTIICQSVFAGVLLGFVGTQIVAEQALVGTIPQVIVVFAGNSYRGAVVQTVHAKGACPAVGGDVETA